MNQSNMDIYYDNFFDNVAHSRNGALSKYYDDMCCNKTPIEHYKIYKHIMTKYYENNNFLNVTYNLSRWEPYLKIKNEITNFKIHLTDNTVIHCIKKALYIIPYFKILFNDCDDGDEIALDTDPTITKSIIDSLYFGNLKDSLTVTNVINTFEILDKFMFYDAIHDVLQFIQKHHNTIIENMLENDFNDIFVLKMLLDNVMNNDFKDVNYVPFGIEPIKNVTRSTIILIFEIVGRHLNNNYDDNKNIFMFNDWFKIFNSNIKFDAIKQFKKYELFNISDIASCVILKFLIEEFPHLECYNDICNYFPKVYFNEPIEKYIGKCFHYAIITSYYPKFEYMTITTLDSKSVLNNKIKISTQINTKEINIGTKILLSQNNTIHNEFIITGFNKCVNNKIVPVQQLTRIGIPFATVHYEIILNKTLTHPTPQNCILYLVNNYSF